MLFTLVAEDLFSSKAGFFFVKFVNFIPYSSRTIDFSALNPFCVIAWAVLFLFLLICFTPTLFKD